jgi:hypothetical protein
MHPALKKGTKNFHYTSNSCGIFCDFTFSPTKIPMEDMEVQVYSKFSKNKIWKKIKSPTSMRNGRFNTSKYKGKLQKIGEETLKGLFSRFLIPGVVNSCWLATTHACPAHTSPKNFKHP